MRSLFIITIIAVILTTGCQGNKEKTLMEENNMTVETILSRRSIRQYQPEQIKQSELDIILNCGINAPSAMNKQPWAIRVIQNQEFLKEINAGFAAFTIAKNPEMAERFGNPDNSFYYNAPTFILLGYDTTNKFSLNDCGMLALNMELAAESMNIGTCTIGCVIDFLEAPEGADFRAKLNLPENYKLSIGIAAGYKAQSPEAKPRDPNKIEYIR